MGNSLTHRNDSSTKRTKMNSCQDFLWEKHGILPLYDMNKRKDSVNNSLNIIFNHGKGSIDSINCIVEQVNNRRSLHPDTKACDKCFNYPSIDNVSFRIRRMNHILTVEIYLIKRKSSHTGYFEISKYLKSVGKLVDHSLISSWHLARLG